MSTEAKTFFEELLTKPAFTQIRMKSLLEHALTETEKKHAIQKALFNDEKGKFIEMMVPLTKEKLLVINTINFDQKTFYEVNFINPVTMEKERSTCICYATAAEALLAGTITHLGGNEVILNSTMLMISGLKNS